MSEKKSGINYGLNNTRFGSGCHRMGVKGWTKGGFGLADASCV